MKILKVKCKDAKNGIYKVGDYKVEVENDSIIYVNGVSWRNIDKKLLDYLEKKLKI